MHSQQFFKLSLALVLSTSSGCLAKTPITPIDSKIDRTIEHKKSDVGSEQPSKASFYGDNDGTAGEKTASGEIFNPDELTAAHKSYPFGTKLEVTNTETGETVKVRVNDRGPYVKGRSLDLSRKAAEEIGITKKGVAKVKVKVTEKPKP